MMPGQKTAFRRCYLKTRSGLCGIFVDNIAPLIIYANVEIRFRQSKLGRAMEELQRLQIIYLLTP